MTTVITPSQSKRRVNGRLRYEGFASHASPVRASAGITPARTNDDLSAPNTPTMSWRKRFELSELAGAAKAIFLALDQTTVDDRDEFAELLVASRRRIRG
jgi:hypothetical protein